MTSYVAVKLNLGNTWAIAQSMFILNYLSVDVH